jgi:gamma-glutamyl-gamma-aminobutyrate hydrolase PuuD
MLNKKIFVVGSNSYAEALIGLGKLTFDSKDFFENPEDFSLVLFTGGVDVSPELYGDTSPKGHCGTNPDRDAFESKIFIHARKYGIRMTGICRGCQFINVMSGGRMLHHITGHGASHSFASYNSGDVIQVSSTHHQMCIPSDKGYVVGWSAQRRSQTYIGFADEKEEYTGPEVEAVLYPSTLCFGVQYHPEFMLKDSAGYKWYWQAIKAFLLMPIDEFTKLYTEGTNARISVGSTE